MRKKQNKPYVSVREEMAKRMAFAYLSEQRVKRGLGPLVKKLPDGWWGVHGDEWLAKYDREKRRQRAADS